MKIIMLSLSLCIATILESVYHVPLALSLLIFTAIFYPKEWVFLLAVVTGIILDSLTFRILGTTSLFFLVTLGALFLYSRKFETQHVLFGILFASIVSSIYLFFFQSFNLLQESLTIILISLLFGSVALFFKQKSASI